MRQGEAVADVAKLVHKDLAVAQVRARVGQEPIRSPTAM
jgi:hypothetical protein